MRDRCQTPKFAMFFKQNPDETTKAQCLYMHAQNGYHTQAIIRTLANERSAEACWWLAMIYINGLITIPRNLNLARIYLRAILKIETEQFFSKNLQPQFSEAALEQLNICKHFEKIQEHHRPIR